MPKKRALPAKRVRGSKKAGQASTSVAEPTSVSARAKLSNPFVAFWQSLVLLARHWRLFGGILLVYMLLSFVLVKGLSVSRDFANSKDIFEQIYSSDGGKARSGFALFGLLISTANVTGSESASIFQSVLLVIMSLVIIWTLRRVFDNKSARVKEAFYGAMHPLVPFVLVLMVVGLQLLPLVVTSALYSTVTSSGLVVTPIEQVVWALVVVVGLIVSLFFISSSVFALYAVTLPGMEPREALRSARTLVRKRRWAIILRLVILPILVLLAAAVVMLPIIWLLPPLAEVTFFVLTIIGLAVTHTYLYSLYWELIA